MPKDIHAVLFDVDGTLLDTFEFIYQSFEFALAAHGLDVPGRDVIAQTMGGPLEACYRALSPHGDAVALTEAHRVFQTEHIELVRRFPATLEVLEALTAGGLKLGAVTTRSLRTSVRSMEVTGIAKYFGVIVSAEDVTNHKPHPEPIQKALAALGVSAAHALMVGDTTADILAGKNAGLRTVGAMYGFGAATLEEARPDYVIRDLRSLLSILE